MKNSLIETSEKTKKIGDLTGRTHCRHISQIFWPHLRATSSLKQTKTVIPRGARSHGGKQHNFYRLYLISIPWLIYIINDLTIDSNDTYTFHDCHQIEVKITHTLSVNSDTSPSHHSTKPQSESGMH